MYFFRYICIIYINIYICHYKSASQLRLGRIFRSSRDLVDASGTKQHPTQGGKSWYNSQATVHMEPGTAPSWNVGGKLYVFINKMCIC